MWRYLAESVLGTSHERSNTSCQDSHKITNYTVAGKDYLILACSDGAGSASHSDLGSSLACEVAIAEVCRFLDTEAALATVDQSMATQWLEDIRGRMMAEAELHAVDLRQLAATLLLAVAGDSRSIFIQIGDGAIVTFEAGAEGDVMELVFWPQNGEYANTTNFLTDPKFAELVMFAQKEKCPDGIAAFTDGVQLLALDYVTKAPHSPFFDPFFKQLRETSEPENLIVPFRQLLNSKPVNDRTDDDKTLVIAVREIERAD